jgi:hypothetical protein
MVNTYVDKELNLLIKINTERFTILSMVKGRITMSSERAMK